MRNQENKQGEEEMLSIAEAADALGVTPEAIYNLMKTTELQPAQAGSKGRGKGARLSRTQVEELRAVRIARLEEELRRARGES